VGVYVTTTGGSIWTVMGTGLPNVSIRDMALNLALNTLSVATYGRGEFMIRINNSQANAGGLVALGGNVNWTGPITMVGATTASAAGGTQYQRNSPYSASLNIVGTISDMAGTTNNQLTKIGLGNVILSGSNTYTGITDVHEGVLIVNNPHALSGVYTLVESGTALQLESSVTGEPLALNGDGPVGGFNGHNTGAPESISNVNTYSGDR
jgi:autotransporter-associated beta strand protein